jgi:hypothetical protein
VDSGSANVCQTLTMESLTSSMSASVSAPPGASVPGGMLSLTTATGDPDVTARTSGGHLVTGPVPPYSQPAAESNAPKVLGIIGIVLAFCCSPVGIILGVISYVMAKQRNQSTTLGLVAIILGAAFLVLGIVLNVAGVIHYPMSK